MKYTKIFSDEEGETHFEDVEVELELTEFTPPIPPINISSYTSAKRYGFWVFPSGWFGDWHTAPRKQIFFVLSGESEAMVSDGEVRRFSSGSVLLVEDTWGKGHKSRILSSEDMVVAVVHLPD